MPYKKIAWCFAFLFLLWLSGFVWFVSLIPIEPTRDMRKTDAIVVLTGGPGRIEHGFILLSKLYAPHLFISGVSSGTSLRGLIAAAPPDIRRELLAMPGAISLGYHAVNTIGNAEESARWLRTRHYRSVRLVTANYHMPRSVSEFEEALPEILIIPDPVFTENFVLSELWHHSDRRTMLFLEYHKYIAAKFRHLLLHLP